MLSRFARLALFSSLGPAMFAVDLSGGADAQTLLDPSQVRPFYRRVELGQVTAQRGRLPSGWTLSNPPEGTGVVATVPLPEVGQGIALYGAPWVELGTADDATLALDAGYRYNLAAEAIVAEGSHCRLAVKSVNHFSLFAGEEAVGRGVSTLNVVSTNTQACRLPITFAIGTPVRLRVLFQAHGAEASAPITLTSLTLTREPLPRATLARMDEWRMRQNAQMRRIEGNAPAVDLDWTGVTITNRGPCPIHFACSGPAWREISEGERRYGAWDFGAAGASSVIESDDHALELGGLASFTIAVWVNCRDATAGPGGNRIVSWINDGKHGVDLVHLSDGSLQLSVNQWPDFSPVRSERGSLPSDAEAGADNWRFVVAIYDSNATSGHAELLMGTLTQAPWSLGAFDYPMGPVGPEVGPVAIGNFNALTGRHAPFRMFRGLIRRPQIFGRALSAEEIGRLHATGSLAAERETPSDHAARK